MDKTLVLWARASARRVIHLWPDAPPQVLEWLDTGDSALIEGARLYALDMKSDSWSAKEAAAAMDAAAGAATSRIATGAWVEWTLVRAQGAVFSALPEATHEEQKFNSHWELIAQQCLRRLIRDLAIQFQAHGLSALRLEDAQIDPWLTREVWRALALPDLTVVEDWHRSSTTC